MEQPRTTTLLFRVRCLIRRSSTLTLLTLLWSSKRFLRRPFTARLAAQRNARVFQSTLVERELAVDAHTLALLGKLSDPALLKVNNG